LSASGPTTTIAVGRVICFAGKTTLMDVICGRKTVGRTTGHLLVNGQPIVKSSWSRVVGYVEQMDVHTPAQTVIEALWFSGRLRLSPKVSDQQVGGARCQGTAWHSGKQPD
jgi:ABC-type multidrug transport system ATPase subunit